MVFGLNFFSRSLGTDDLIRSSKELEQITQRIQQINKKNTLLDKIVSSKHLAVIYVSHLAIVFMKVYNTKYQYAVIVACLVLIGVIQFYMVKPFVNWVQLKRLSKLRKRHEFIINTLKDRSSFEKINFIINRFTAGDDKDQDFKSILDEDIKERMKKLETLNSDIEQKSEERNALFERNDRSKKGMLKRFIDNMENNDDEILHNMVVEEVFEEVLVKAEFVCEGCKKAGTVYVKRDDVHGQSGALQFAVQHCFQCE